MLNQFALIIRKLFPEIYQTFLNIKQVRYIYTFNKKKYSYSFWVNSFQNEEKNSIDYLLFLENGGLHKFLDDISIYPNYHSMKKAQEIIYRDLEEHMPLLVGNCGFICKPYTPITTE